MYLRADVTPANKLGMKCAWVNRGDRLLGADEHPPVRKMRQSQFLRL
jgi:FMN phosphatase YigB (HAD superfamily)